VVETAAATTPQLLADQVSQPDERDERIVNDEL
jgi:hypothetical protein